MPAADRARDRRVVGGYVPGVVRDEVGSVGKGVGLGVASLCLVQFTDVLGVTVVVAALPRMLADLNASPDAGSLIATGYAMFFSGLLMLGARLGDRFGHRRVILAGLLTFAVGAVLGASATTVVTLTAARCLQGAAAACSVPSALRLLTTITSEGRQRQRAVAAWSAAGAAAGASGFVIGGVVTDVASWRLIFWGYLPVAVILAAGIARTIPPDRNPDCPPPVPLASSLLFTATVMGFVIATTLLPNKSTAYLGATLVGVAFVLAGLFIVVDRAAEAPLLPRSLLRKPPLRQGAIGALLNTLTTSSTITLTTLYLQNTRGLGPLTAAAALLPFSLAVIVGSALAAPSLARWPPQRVIAAGLAAIAICDAALISSAAGAWTVPLHGRRRRRRDRAVLGGGDQSGNERCPERARNRRRDHQHLSPARHCPRHRPASPRRGPHHRNPRATHPSPSAGLDPRRRNQPRRGRHLRSRGQDGTRRTQTRWGRVSSRRPARLARCPRCRGSE